MARDCRIAQGEDVPDLMGLMTEFYLASGYALDRQRARKAFETIMSDTSLGRVWLIEAKGRTAGYMVMTLGFSMEYGGRDAFLDDLFLKPEYRGAGLGKAALKTFFDVCAELNVRAVHLEVERQNVAAKSLYRRFGFRDNDRQLLTCRMQDRV